MDVHIYRSISNQNIDTLIKAFITDNAAERKNAQWQLRLLGSRAVPALINLLRHPLVEIRGEAATTLGEIRDPSAIPALLDLLEDEAIEVRWQAAKSLIKMKRACVIPLLKELQDPNRFGSQRFRECSRHILRVLNKQGYLGPSIQVVKAFDAPENEITVPWAAEKVLEILELAH